MLIYIALYIHNGAFGGLRNFLGGNSGLSWSSLHQYWVAKPTGIMRLALLVVLEPCQGTILGKFVQSWSHNLYLCIQFLAA